MGMVYKWKTGFYKTPASVAADVMEGLSQNGGLTAESLVDASRPEDAPLHNEFEWNNDKAAELYRQDQARTMIQSIVVINEASPAQETTRAFVHIQQGESKQYEPIQVVIRDEDKLKLLYETAKRELEAFRNKYKGIKAFEKVFLEIDNLPEKIA